MSAAAGIAAAKNRRSKTEPNQKNQLPPPVSCSSKNKSCPLPSTPKNAQKTVPHVENKMVDPVSLQILGPMAPVQILRLHEQRLNQFDEKLNQVFAQERCQKSGDEDDEECKEECFSRIGMLESKLGMLEEVIMTLQNKLTIAQNFAMETNMSVMKLVNAQQAQAQQAQAQAQQAQAQAQQAQAQAQQAQAQQAQAQAQQAQAQQAQAQQALVDYDITDETINGS